MGDSKEELPVVVCVRTALSQSDEGIFRRLPKEMRLATVNQVVRYCLDAEELSADEQAMAASIHEEMAAKEKYTTNVNGRENVGGETPISELFVEKREDMGGSTVLYSFADLKVARGEGGGLERRF